jgi:hypothetical protein
VAGRADWGDVGGDPIVNIQCATCINHDLMYQVGESNYHVLNEVTHQIQKWARELKCSAYFPAHQYEGDMGR